METDKTTLNDLAIFNAEEDFSVFSYLDCAHTSNGREQLRKNFSTPLSGIDAIVSIQETIKAIHSKKDKWPTTISNGTIMVIERFYGTAIDALPQKVSAMDAVTYKIFHGPDYSLVKYSVGHCFDFIKGMKAMHAVFDIDSMPAPLQKVLLQTRKLTSNANLDVIDQYSKCADMTIAAQLQLAQFARFSYKNQMLELLNCHAQLDAWWGMATAMRKYNLVFPGFAESQEPFLEVSGLYHLLLSEPTPYDISLDRRGNFLFLTGANMAGKSTFIKSVGIAVFLAHTGMAVPAKKMELSVFDGLLSNINVVDNIARGESYFFNEVQRIKATVSKVNDGKKWLILIDELFKGTNVQDAMKCSLAVIEGLLKIKNSLFILSTHLYEIGEELKQYPNIHFNYFETSVQDGQLSFSYHLKNGISNDRLGYLILKREGVVKMLEDL
ncbi:MAG: DNA mismatch repair protein MutS [Chitinophagaceae bacterium]|nr:MAG: DNA mismatch repair protein MutS [Chitinophagaceae bacterium]